MKNLINLNERLKIISEFDKNKVKLFIFYVMMKVFNLIILYYIISLCHI